MKIFSGPLGAVWGPFVMVFIEGDKQTMGPRSTTYKMLTSGAVGRGFEKLRFWGGGGGGTPKFTILTPPQRTPKKLWGPQFWRFLSNFDNFGDFPLGGVKSWNRSVVKIYMYISTSRSTHSLNLLDYRNACRASIDTPFRGSRICQNYVPPLYRIEIDVSTF